MRSVGYRPHRKDAMECWKELTGVWSALGSKEDGFFLDLAPSWMPDASLKDLKWGFTPCTKFDQITKTTGKYLCTDRHKHSCLHRHAFIQRYTRAYIDIYTHRHTYIWHMPIFC